MVRNKDIVEARISALERRIEELASVLKPSKSKGKAVNDG